MATRKEYDYDSSPLPKDKRTFRLIQLLKHAVGNVLYDLVPFQLANAPDYEAISYRWGSPELSHSITIGTASLRITSSVYDILNDNCLRPQETGETRYLWIDFVCINQNDETDKDKQIPLMRDIYAGASKVVIYLGDAPDAPLAHQFFPRFEHFYSTFTAPRTVPIFDILAPSLNPLKDRPSREAFLRMATHDYWSRTWIIQEIACGKQVSILYGGHYVDWEMVSAAASLLKTENDMSNMLLEGFDEARSTVILSALSCIFSIFLLQKTLATGTLFPLANILLTTGYSKASLAKDKVVALVGLSRDADHPDLQPNHELAVEQVYLKVTIHSLQQGSFALLSIAGLANRELYGSTISGLPSWVPDFSSSGLLPTLDNPYWPYRAGGAWTEAKVVTDIEFDHPVLNCLVVKGMVIGRIAVMSTLHVQPSYVEESMHLFGERLPHELDFHHEIWEMVETHCQEPYLFPNGVAITRGEALWRTVVGNMDMEHEITYPAPEESGRGYAVFQSACKALRRGDFVSRVKELQANRWDWHCFHKVISRMRKSTCPFVVTDEGHMGAVVAGAKVGDLVCIFRGAKVPYILRPNKDDDKSKSSRLRAGTQGIRRLNLMANHPFRKGKRGTMQLVCPSYIHGFMDGEAIECGKYEETWFHIV